MFDVAPSEFFIVALVALIVIGPKDLPKAMRVVGYWVGRARGVARQFRSGFDTMVREAELAEMEKKWAEENARILAEHPSTEADVATTSEPLMLPLAENAAGTSGTPLKECPPDAQDEQADLFSDPVLVEKPVVEPAALGGPGTGTSGTLLKECPPDAQESEAAASGTLLQECPPEPSDLPVLVEKPVVEPAPTAEQPPAENKVGS